MIKPLRKKHLQIWQALMILLPAGIFAAWLVIPKPEKGQLLQPSLTEALPVVLKSVEKENYTINFRGVSDSAATQLEWINKIVLTFPTAVIYKASYTGKNLEGAELIGRIEATGTYRFALPTVYRPGNLSTYKLILYDFIHEQIIDTINFEP